ncbi:MAG: FtsX-like permease family protein, partial [Candidatus Acidiferrales bacterium]
IGGAVIGVFLMSLIEKIRLPGIEGPLRMSQPFDWRMFLFVGMVAAASGLLAGVVPAFRATRIDLNDTLRESGRSLTGGATHNRLRNFLVVAQAAGSLVALIMAGLFLRSLQHAEKADLGFQPEHLMNLTIDVGDLGYDEQRGANFYRELGSRVRALPGVQSASFAYAVPLGYYSVPLNPVWNESQRGLPVSQVLAVSLNKVGPDYFSTMRIEIVRGRAIDERDQNMTPLVAVVNELFAQQLWPGQDPIGHHFRRVSAAGPDIEVVGVAKYSKYASIGEVPAPHFYVPLAQDYTPLRVLQVRSLLPPASIVHEVEAQVHALDPNLPVFEAMPMAEALEGGNGFFFLRVAATFAGALGGLNLLLAVVGLYGVISYAVNQRLHEIGVRIALGAQRQKIFGMVIGQGLRLVLTGLAIGVAISAALSRFLGSMLVDTGALDPLAFASASLLLVGVAALACYIPARRAMRVDPMVALRYE